MTFFLIQFSISFITIFLRGVQTFNVIHHNYKGAALTSVGMSLTYVMTIGLVASDPWGSLIPVSLGSVTGVLTAMKRNERGKKNDNNSL